MNNDIKIGATIAMMGLGLALAAVAVRVQTNPLAFTKPAEVTNVTLPVVPIDTPKLVVRQEPPTITLAPIVIKGRASTKMGAAYPKKTQCKLTYRVIGFSDSEFKTFRGVWIKDCND